MRKTGQSPSLTELSLVSSSPQECKREKKVKANYVAVQSVGFFHWERTVFWKKQNKILSCLTQETLSFLSELYQLLKNQKKILKIKSTGKRLFCWTGGQTLPVPGPGHSHPWGHLSAGLAWEVFLCHGTTTQPWHNPVPSPGSSLTGQPLLQGGSQWESPLQVQNRVEFSSSLLLTL